MFNQKIFLIALLSMILAGCSLTPLQQDFSCPYKDGEPCVTITQADQKIQSQPLAKTQKANHTEKGNFESPAFQNYPELPSDAIVPRRRPDVIKRIWLAPFEDVDHNWHAASYVYTVDKPAHWVPIGVSVPKSLSIVELKKEARP